MNINPCLKNLAKIVQTYSDVNLPRDLGDCMLYQQYYLLLLTQKGVSKSAFMFINTEQVPEMWLGEHSGGYVSYESRMNPSEKELVVGWRIWEAVCKTVLTDDILLLVLQIGNLENYYHFYHSKTFKRSTLSSRGPHTFLRMDPQVQISAPGAGYFPKA